MTTKKNKSSILDAIGIFKKIRSKNPIIDKLLSMTQSTEDKTKYVKTPYVKAPYKP